MGCLEVPGGHVHPSLGASWRGQVLKGAGRLPALVHRRRPDGGEEGGAHRPVGLGEGERAAGADQLADAAEGDEDRRGPDGVGAHLVRAEGELEPEGRDGPRLEADELRGGPGVEGRGRVDGPAQPSPQEPPALLREQAEEPAPGPEEPRQVPSGAGDHVERVGGHERHPVGGPGQVGGGQGAEPGQAGCEDVGLDGRPDGRRPGSRPLPGRLGGQLVDELCYPPLGLVPKREVHPPGRPVPTGHHRKGHRGLPGRRVDPVGDDPSEADHRRCGRGEGGGGQARLPRHAEQPRQPGQPDEEEAHGRVSPAEPARTTGAVRTACARTHSLGPGPWWADPPGPCRPGPRRAGPATMLHYARLASRSQGPCRPGRPQTEGSG